MRIFNKEIVFPEKAKFWKKITVPEFLKIDFSKPLTFANQFTVMMVILTISCLLFTVVYVVQLSRGVIVAEGTTVPVHVNEENIDTDSPEYQENIEIPYSDTEPESEPEPTWEEPESPKKTVLDTEVFSITETENITKSAYEVHDGYLILVNKYHECFHYGENVVSLLDVKNNTYDITDSSVCVDENIVDNINDFLDDFYYYCGESDIMIACGYRSYDLQSQLYEEEVANRGSEDEAAEWVAPPGYSEHQTGYAFDFDLNIEEGSSGIDFDGTGMYSWIHENCGDYGFILRYLEDKTDITGYSYEPWHFRYVGVPHSLYIQEEGCTLEEYIEMLHEHQSDNAIVINGDDDHQWCVYYVEANEEGETEVPVPTDYEYEISGDNFSGFIVTVKLK